MPQPKKKITFFTIHPDGEKKHEIHVPHWLGRLYTDDNNNGIPDSFDAYATHLATNMMKNPEARKKMEAFKQEHPEQAKFMTQFEENPPTLQISHPQPVPIASSTQPQISPTDKAKQQNIIRIIILIIGLVIIANLVF